jgi:hypothetical protein
MVQSLNCVLMLRSYIRFLVSLVSLRTPVDNVHTASNLSHVVDGFEAHETVVTDSHCHARHTAIIATYPPAVSEPTQTVVVIWPLVQGHSKQFHGAVLR